MVEENGFLELSITFDEELVAFKLEKDKFINGNKSAGTRMRKSLLRIKSLAHQLKAESITFSPAED